MAWITPVTNRTDGAYCTVTDMNRIAGNIDWLATELTTYQLYTGPTVAKTTYVYNDYVTAADWTDILSVLDEMVKELVIEAGQADDSTTYDNFNRVESITLAIYDRLQEILKQSANNHYAGDNIYSEGAVSVYSAGFAA